MTQEKKQTAVEWLIEKVKSKEWQDMFIWNKEEVFNEALKMEEEQSIELWQGGINCTEEGGKSFDQYYKNNFNK